MLKNYLPEIFEYKYIQILEEKFSEQTTKLVYQTFSPFVQYLMDDVKGKWILHNDMDTILYEQNAIIQVNESGLFNSNTDYEKIYGYTNPNETDPNKMLWFYYVNKVWDYLSKLHTNRSALALFLIDWMIVFHINDDVDLNYIFECIEKDNFIPLLRQLKNDLQTNGQRDKDKCYNIYEKLLLNPVTADKYREKIKHSSQKGEQSENLAINKLCKILKTTINDKDKIFYMGGNGKAFDHTGKVDIGYINKIGEIETVQVKHCPGIKHDGNKTATILWDSEINFNKSTDAVKITRFAVVTEIYQKETCIFISTKDKLFKESGYKKFNMSKDLFDKIIFD